MFLRFSTAIYHPRPLLLRNFFSKLFYLRLSLCSASKRRFSASSGEENVWNWVPPRQNNAKERLKENAYRIPVIKKAMLSPVEVQNALISHGGENVIVLPLNGKLDNITSFVIATARSTRHLRKMSDMLQEAAKDREIPNGKGRYGIFVDEGDDWITIDCNTFVVHLLLPNTRTQLDLETHWSLAERPYAVYHKNEDIYDRQFEDLLDKYPCTGDILTPAELIDVKDFDEAATEWQRE